MGVERPLRGLQGPAGATGAAGASPESYTYTATGDILANGGTEDFNASTLPLHGCIVGATFVATAGDATTYKAELFDGDPGGVGVRVAYLYGSAFSSLTITTEVGGPQPSPVGSPMLLAIPYLAAAPWIRLTNTDAINDGRASLVLKVIDLA